MVGRNKFLQMFCLRKMSSIIDGSLQCYTSRTHDDHDKDKDKGDSMEDSIDTEAWNKVGFKEKAGGSSQGAGAMVVDSATSSSSRPSVVRGFDQHGSNIGAPALPLLPAAEPVTSVLRHRCSSVGKTRHRRCCLMQPCSARQCLPWARRSVYLWRSACALVGFPGYVGTQQARARVA